MTFFYIKNVTCEGLITGMRSRGHAQLALLTRLSCHCSPDPLALLKCPGMGREGVAQSCSSKNITELVFFSLFKKLFLFLLPRPPGLSFGPHPAAAHHTSTFTQPDRSQQLSWVSCQQQTQFLAVWGKTLSFYPGNTAYAILFGSLLSICA